MNAEILFYNVKWILFFKALVFPGCSSKSTYSYWPGSGVWWRWEGWSSSSWRVWREESVKRIYSPTVLFDAGHGGWKMIMFEIEYFWKSRTRFTVIRSDFQGPFYITMKPNRNHGHWRNLRLRYTHKSTLCIILRTIQQLTNFTVLQYTWGKY